MILMWLSVMMILMWLSVMMILWWWYLLTLSYVRHNSYLSCNDQSCCRRTWHKICQIFDELKRNDPSLSLLFALVVDLSLFIILLVGCGGTYPGADVWWYLTSCLKFSSWIFSIYFHMFPLTAPLRTSAKLELSPSRTTCTALKPTHVPTINFIHTSQNRSRFISHKISFSILLKSWKI